MTTTIGSVADRTTTTPGTATVTDRAPAGLDWHVERLTGHLGAQVSGVDLAAVAHDDDEFAQLRRLLLEHKVLFFRDQDVDRADHVALGERFGPLEDHPVAGSDPDHPGLVRIYKKENSAPDRYENAYHSDGSWRATPAMGAILRCISCPPVGGDTIWVDMVAAYEGLPDHVKEIIGDLHARHSIEASFGGVLDPEARRAMAGKFPDAEHPVVRTHPETGEKILYVNSFTTHFVNFHRPAHVTHGIDYAPGASALLTYLQSRASIPEYQVRWRWEPNSVAIWDNRNTQHYAVMDYGTAARRMERAGICGDAPY